MDAFERNCTIAVLTGLIALTVFKAVLRGCQSVGTLLISLN
jgi:hypothetical protein